MDLFLNPHFKLRNPFRILLRISQRQVAGNFIPSRDSQDFPQAFLIIFKGDTGNSEYPFAGCCVQDYSIQHQIDARQFNVLRDSGLRSGPD
jgi:hypothetical protein